MMSRSSGGNIQRQEREALYTNKEHDSLTEDGTGADDIINFIGYGPLQVASYIKINLIYQVARVHT